MGYGERTVMGKGIEADTSPSQWMMCGDKKKNHKEEDCDVPSGGSSQS